MPVLISGLARDRMKKRHPAKYCLGPSRYLTFYTK